MIVERQVRWTSSWNDQTPVISKGTLIAVAFRPQSENEYSGWTALVVRANDGQIVEVDPTELVVDQA